MNMNAFNFLDNNAQPQQQNPPQQQQQNNFGGFDFTNANLPQNKERIDQQNRLSQLENALNSLSMQPQNQGMNNMMNPMMGNNNMGMNMNMGMGMNQNMNNMGGMNNMNFMNNMGMGGGMNNMNNMGMSKPDPFADISLAPKGNQGNNNFNNQSAPNNNPFSFI